MVVTVHLEHGPQVRAASHDSRAVKVAGGVARQAAIRARAVWKPGKGVQHGLIASGLHFENRALAEGAPRAVVPYRLPAESSTRFAKGYAPSDPAANRWSTVSRPDESSLNTVPLLVSPPNKVVPNRLPALSRTSVACGRDPSPAGLPRNEYSTLKLVWACAGWLARTPSTNSTASGSAAIAIRRRRAEIRFANCRMLVIFLLAGAG